MLYFPACLIFLYLIFVLISSVNSIQVSCSNQDSCNQQLGPDSTCMFNDQGAQGTCVCDEYYYQQDNPPNVTCVQCPGIRESCQQSKCCNEDCLICYSDVCMYIYSEYCLGISDSERQRFQRVAQCILAVALILTASILLILFWKACTKRSLVRRRMRHMSIDSFTSLNSIQRLVLLQLQDRPPPYSREYSHPRKLMNEITDPPPSYIEAVGNPEQAEGEENTVFVLGDHLIEAREQSVGVSSTSNITQNISVSENPTSLQLQNTLVSTATTSTATQSHLEANTRQNSQSVSPQYPVESYPSQNRLGRCCETNLVLTSNTELHI